MLFCVVVLVGFIPAVQTFLASKITDHVHQKFSIDISIHKASLTFLGNIALKDVLVNDHRQDTLVFINQLEVNAFGISELVSRHSNISSLELNGLNVFIKTYEEDSVSNLHFLMDRFRKQDADKTAPFSLQADVVKISDGSFTLIDEHQSKKEQLFLDNIDLVVQDFLLKDKNIEAEIENLSLRSKALEISSFRSHLTFSDEKISIDEFDLETIHSRLKGDILIDRRADNDLSGALWKITLLESHIGLKDLHEFNSSFAKKGQIHFESDIEGSINDFSVTGIRLFNLDTHFEGSFVVKNLFNKQKPFLIQNTIDRFSFSEASMNQIIPKAFGTLLPSAFRYFGALEIVGDNVFTPESISSHIEIRSKAGEIKSNLLLRKFSNIDNALYEGEIHSKKFNLGELLNDDRFGNTDFNFSLEGQGLTIDLINSSLNGVIDKLNYRDYTYSNVLISGDIKNELFKGEIVSKDPNLDVHFNGLVDLSRIENYYDFKASFANVNLHNLGIVTDQSTSFSGDVVMQIQGNSQEDFIGDFSLKNALFKTTDKAFDFENLSIQSRNNNGVRVININSKDIVSGILIGEFKFSELSKLIENSVSKTFTKRKLHHASLGQYLSFNFNVNTKIANALYPDLLLDDNTYIKGKIDSDKDLFRLSLRIPSLEVKDTKIQRINLQIDNQNSLYNTYLEVEDIHSKFVKVQNVNLINTFVKDTLYFRTEFEDQASKTNTYQVNFYHTLDESNNSVLGFDFSEFNFRNKRWVLQSGNINSNKIIFEDNGKKIKTQPFRFFHLDEELFIESFAYSPEKQNLNVAFKNVQIQNILPDIPRLDLNGKLTGSFDLERIQGQYTANSSLQITPFSINDYPYQSATVEVFSERDLQRFGVLISVFDREEKVLNLDGFFDVTSSKIPLDLHLTLAKFPVAPFSDLGKNTLSNFKGYFSGDLNLGGSLSSMSMDGEVTMNQSGLSIPYLGVDYDFTNASRVKFRNQTIDFNGVELKDTFFGSKGTMTGTIDHKDFKDWTLDLTFNSERLSILHTQEAPDFLYYGDAFLSGSAHLYGPTKLLTLDVEGSTAKGTSISIPISDATKIDKVSYIKFVDKHITSESEINPISIDDVKGLTLNFDLDVTKDAEVEVVVDPETGSSLKGRGAGNILMEINTNGRFNMWGDFIAYEGVYNFKNLGIFEKEFVLNEGGTIVWDGDPLQAQLNMEAVYSVPGGANPALLSEDLNLNRKIPTLVTTTLTGNLLKFNTPVFSIDFPNTSGAIKSELDYRLSDQEKRQLQAVSLLVQGFFISDVSLSSVTSETFYNNVFQKASGVFDALFADEDGKVNVGFNYLKGDKNAAATLKTRDRLGLTLTTRISDRILLNGKFGVPVSGIEETVFVGDVEIEFLLSKDGNLRARIFNKENEFQYVGDELGFTQGGGLSYQVNFDSFKNLLQKIIQKKTSIPDTDFSSANTPYIRLIPKESSNK